MRNPITPWPAENDVLLRELYADTPNKDIKCMTGWSEQVLKHRSKKLGLKKTRACKAKTANATAWTDDMITFLKDNFFIMTNHQLAAALNLRLTVTRNKARELGLCKLEVDIPWNDHQVKFLVENFRTMGDVEIAEHLQSHWPRKKLWTKKNVNKKRKLLGLYRTREEIIQIISKHVQPGGRSYTILKNSSTFNLQPGYLASLIAWRDKDLQKEILKYPDLLELKRNQLLLNRAIKEAEL